jgi:hypothetical protein
LVHIIMSPSYMAKMIEWLPDMTPYWFLLEKNHLILIRLWAIKRENI